MTNDFNETARRLRNAVEPVAAGVYFALKATAYQALRFGGSPITQDGVARPEMKTYFLRTCWERCRRAFRTTGHVELIFGGWLGIRLI